MTTPDARISWPDGLNEERFLSEYWQKKPLLIRQAFPDFDNPLSPDELGGLALDDGIHSRIILQQKAQHESESDIWHLRNGPFSEEELTELPSRDWSLLVSDIEKHLDGFHQYLEPYRFIPDWRIDDLMISYAPTDASVGAHIDAYDVFLFQASGQRHWSINTDPAADQTLIPDIDLKILAHFSPTDDWVLNPGDLLYLPPGVAHHGVSRDDECMTWSVGFRAPTHSALISDITEQLMQHADQRYQDADLQPVTHKGEIDEQSLKAIKGLWDTATNADMATFTLAVGAVLTQRGESSDDTSPMMTLEDLKTILQHQDVVRTTSSRFAYVKSQSPDNDTGAELFVDGEHYTVSLPLARLLCASYEWVGTELLNACSAADDNACLLTLLQLGALSATD